MGKVSTFVLILCCAAPVIAEDYRNCPQAADQLIIVGPAPVAFRLNVANFSADSTVSIFQYPLGGILEQPGPTDLDFIFVPMADFRGTTTFTYRLTPPRGCGNGTTLRTVTLAGGTAESTASGLVVPEEACGIGMCGAGMVSMLPLMFLGLVRKKISRRTR